MRTTDITSHDALFKNLLKTFFMEFLEAFVPEVHGWIEPGSVQFLDKELLALQRRVRLRKRFVDLVAKVRCRGEETFFIVHVEHQAQRQSDIAQRLLLYAAMLLQDYRLPVVPVLLCSYQEPRDVPEPASYSMTVHGQEVLRLRWRVVQLNKMNWRRYIRQPNPAAAALMTRMGIRREDRVRVKLEIARLIATLRLDSDKMEVISRFVEAYLRLSGAEERKFEKLATDANLREPTMKFYMVGERAGLRKGRREGRLEGIRKAIAEVLEVRLGEAPYLVTEKLGFIDQEAKLRKLLRLASSAKSLDQFSAAL